MEVISTFIYRDGWIRFQNQSRFRVAKDFKKENTVLRNLWCTDQVLIADTKDNFFSFSRQTVAAVVSGIYVDRGNPYKQGPLKVGQLTLSETITGSPLHTLGEISDTINWFPKLSYWKVDKHLFLSNLNIFVHSERRSKSRDHLWCCGSNGFTFSRTNCLISAKLGTKHPLAKGFKFIKMKGRVLFLRGDYSHIKK